MDTTLYLLRQQLDRIPPSLFRAIDADIDIVFVGHILSTVQTSLLEGVTGEGVAAGSSRPTLTYDNLVDKIFSSKHVIVL